MQGFLGPGPRLHGDGLHRVRAARRSVIDVPIVITGFEPLDMLEGMLRTRAAARRRAGRRSRTSTAGPCGPKAIRPAQKLIDDVFEVCDRKWRGIGTIPQSGYRLRAEYRDHDAERLFEVDDIETQESTVCISGQILQGLKKPHECPAFGKECTPQTPLGATMVSAEGRLCRLLRLRPASGQRTAQRSTSTRAIGDGRPIDMSARHDDDSPTDRAVRHLSAAAVAITTASCSATAAAGSLTADLIQRLFVPGFGNDVLAALEDQATVELAGSDNGATGAADRLHHRLVRGAAALLSRRRHRQAGGPRHGQRPGRRRRAAAVSVGRVHPRRRACRSTTCSASSPRCAQACDEAGVALVTGDTKVVDRGKGDQVFITTSGIGLVPEGRVAVDPHRPARRPHPGLGHDRRPRHRHHVGARRDRVRDRPGKRQRPARTT